MYEGITLDELAGHGLRWPERPQGRSVTTGDRVSSLRRPRSRTGTGAPSNGHLRLGTYRPIWASPEVEISPALKYLIAHQQVELSPHDAMRLGVADGDHVIVAQNGTELAATAAVRFNVAPGSAFLADGIAVASANSLTEPLIEVRKV